MKQAVRLAAALAVSWSASAHAQPLQEACTGVPEVFAQRCSVVVQTAAAAQPQLGILTAGGSPVLGLSLGTPAGRLPWLQASARINLSAVHIPDIIIEDRSAYPPPLTAERTVLTGVIGADAAAKLLRGANGIGSVDLLASAVYMPFDVVNRRVYKQESAQFSLGAGARLGLLREAGPLPEVALSLMYRRTGAVQIGSVCEGEEEPDSGSAAGDSTTRCRIAGDVGQVNVDVTDLSARFTLGKTLGRMGLTAGVGFDRYATDAGLHVLGDPLGVGVTGNFRIYHRTADFESDRWSGFLNGALNVGADAAVVLELGWMQGGDAVDGFSGDYDPGMGTVFGSFGGRLPF